MSERNSLSRRHFLTGSSAALIAATAGCLSGGVSGAVGSVTLSHRPGNSNALYADLLINDLDGAIDAYNDENPDSVVKGEIVTATNQGDSGVTPTVTYKDVIDQPGFVESLIGDANEVHRFRITNAFPSLDAGDKLLTSDAEIDDVLFSLPQLEFHPAVFLSSTFEDSTNIPVTYEGDLFGFTPEHFQNVAEEYGDEGAIDLDALPDEFGESTSIDIGFLRELSEADLSEDRNGGTSWHYGSPANTQVDPTSYQNPFQSIRDKADYDGGVTFDPNAVSISPVQDITTDGDRESIAFQPTLRYPSLGVMMILAQVKHETLMAAAEEIPNVDDATAEVVSGMEAFSSDIVDILGDFTGARGVMGNLPQGAVGQVLGMGTEAAIRSQSTLRTMASLQGNIERSFDENIADPLGSMIRESIDRNAHGMQRLNDVDEDTIENDPESDDARREMRKPSFYRMADAARVEAQLLYPSLMLGDPESLGENLEALYNLLQDQRATAYALYGILYDSQDGRFGRSSMISDTPYEEYQDDVSGHSNGAYQYRTPYYKFIPRSEQEQLAQIRQTFGDAYFDDMESGEAVQFDLIIMGLEFVLSTVEAQLLLLQPFIDDPLNF